MEFQIASKPVIHVAREGIGRSTNWAGLAQGLPHRVDHSRGEGVVERFAAGDPDPLVGCLVRESRRRCSANMMPPGKIVDHPRQLGQVLIGCRPRAGDRAPLLR